METWSIVFEGREDREESRRESLCTLGNGYIATRGASEDSHADGGHYPGTYLAGGYDRLETIVQGQKVMNEDLVNWPNWLGLSFRHPNEDWFDQDAGKVSMFRQELDLKEAELRRSLVVEDAKGRKSEIRSKRFLSMDNAHVGGLLWSLRPLNWSGTIEVKSFIDGSVTNDGVRRYRGLANKHLQVKELRRLDENSYLCKSATVQSELVMVEAIRTNVYKNQVAECAKFQYWEAEEQNGLTFSLACTENQEITIEKIFTVFTSRDRASADPAHEAVKLLESSAGYADLFKRHSKRWEYLWDKCDIELSENLRETKLLRFHIFHLLQTVSHHTIDLDVGVPARGLHGEAYRGHIFWDEIFILPFLNFHLPEIARALLLYRYRRLAKARLNARSQGFEGALFPWQSGSDGEEASQKLHLNPLSNHWIEDSTFKQRHVNSAIVYNLWHYYQATADREFISSYGAEMALEIARFWIDHLEYNEQTGRFDIRQVVGPDEFHTKYPDRIETGIDNNAYTNYMASWSIEKAIELFEVLADDRKKELLDVLELRESDFPRWKQVANLVALPISRDGLLHQFEGFDRLKTLDFNHYRKKYGNIHRIDRLLEAEGDSANNYQVNKQADVLMLFYLFSPEEIAVGFRRLGYDFKPSSIPLNIDYHLSLSTEGSTLSTIVHSWVLSRFDNRRSYHWFERALESDISDIQGGTTAEGIHLGAMAGTVDLVQRCFCGLEIRDDVLWISPRFPEGMRQLKSKVTYRGHSLLLERKDDTFTIRVERSWAKEGKIGFQGAIHEFKQGDKFNFVI